MIAGLTPAQEAEVRYGVKVGEPSNRIVGIAPRPDEGRHAMLGSRTTPTADWWTLMIKDQGTCSCAHGPRRWSADYRGRTCGTCGKPPGRHRTVIA
ncbi:HNH endonuclease [Mycobacterium phage LilMcDreamy]|uniref:Uncharacterized protein n=1 Tax=Mycobacterium phage LilMcDreamy TaxID=2652422 RepID=A0A5P8D6P1_9CAUD|nr:HNH endonuclease [Mycobacterium phage LilMcDreamy]QFP94697.1 hypothetical protein SEA_LILMCDREAMY_77 [Mycobacterium phage LilMcDreamy]